MQNMYAHWPGAVLDGNPLEQVANEFGLYARERRELSFGDFVRGFRKDIILSALSGSDPTVRRFTLSFESNDPQTAMKVAARLASVLVEHAEEADSMWNRWLGGRQNLKITFTPPARARFRVVDPGTPPTTRVRLPSLPYLGGGLVAGFASGLGTLPLLLWWRRRQPSWLKWSVAGAMLGAMAGFIAFRLATPLYRASVVLEIPEQNPVATIGDPLARLRTIRERIVTQPRLARALQRELALHPDKQWPVLTEARLQEVLENFHVDSARASPLRDGFTLVSLSFEGTTRRGALYVVEMLTSEFVQESIDSDRHARIMEGAKYPEAPFSPRLFPHLALGALAGLTTGPLLSLWHTARRGWPQTS